MPLQACKEERLGPSAVASAAVSGRFTSVVIEACRATLNPGAAAPGPLLAALFARDACEAFLYDHREKVKTNPRCQYWRFRNPAMALVTHLADPSGGGCDEVDPERLLGLFRVSLASGAFLEPAADDAAELLRVRGEGAGGVPQQQQREPLIDRQLTRLGLFLRITESLHGSSAPGETPPDSDRAYAFRLASLQTAADLLPEAAAAAVAVMRPAAAPQPLGPQQHPASLGAASALLRILDDLGFMRNELVRAHNASRQGGGAAPDAGRSKAKWGVAAASAAAEVSAMMALVDGLLLLESAQQQREQEGSTGTAAHAALAPGRALLHMVWDSLEARAPELGGWKRYDASGSGRVEAVHARWLEWAPQVRQEVGRSRRRAWPPAVAGSGDVNC